MGYNSGFARANNEGMKRASTEIILLLNPDTIIITDCINKCLERFIVDRAIGCSVRLKKLRWFTTNNQRELFHGRRA